MMMIISLIISKLLQYNFSDKNLSFTEILTWITVIVPTWNEISWEIQVLSCVLFQWWYVRTSSQWICCSGVYWWYHELHEQWLSSEALLGLSSFYLRVNPGRLLDLNTVVSLYLSLCVTHQFLCVLFSYVLPVYLSRYPLNLNQNEQNLLSTNLITCNPSV